MIVGGSFVAGIGFTVSLLIASIAFDGQQLEEAKLGVLAAAIGATLLSWVAFRLIALLPPAVRARQIAGTAEELLDLSDDVDPERDHIRGPEKAPVTLVEYGDYQCPYCGQAEVVVRELLESFGDDLRYVWRHLPLTDVHPDTQGAAEAAEAAAAQGAFWPMHDRMLGDQSRLTFPISRPTRPSSASTSSASRASSSGASTSRVSPRTWRARTRAAWPARRPSSSTGDVTTGHMTWRP